MGGLCGKENTKATAMPQKTDVTGKTGGVTGKAGGATGKTGGATGKVDPAAEAERIKQE